MENFWHIDLLISTKYLVLDNDKPGNGSGVGCMTIQAFWLGEGVHDQLKNFTFRFRNEVYKIRIP